MDKERYNELSAQIENLEESLFERLTDRMEDTENLEESLFGRLADRMLEVEKKINKLSTEKLEEHLYKINQSLAEFEHNSEKFGVMMKELNGCVVRCRALFNEQKKTKPIWNKISEVSPPEQAEVWIKDTLGNETLAKCEGGTIIYPMSSDMKPPEFWKPV